MNRDDMLKHIFEETRSATLAYYAYMHANREYVAGQKLFLREMHFLLFVGGSESISMTEVANHLEVSQGAATQIAGRLLKKGLIMKAKSLDDKRYTVIKLTERGAEVYEEYLVFDKARRDEVNAYMDDFTLPELETVLKYEKLIKKICAEFMCRRIGVLS